jgi:hypothetical protein
VAEHLVTVQPKDVRWSNPSAGRAASASRNGVQLASIDRSTSAGVGVAIAGTVAGV